MSGSVHILVADDPDSVACPALDALRAAGLKPLPRFATTADGFVDALGERVDWDAIIGIEREAALDARTALRLTQERGVVAPLFVVAAAADDRQTLAYLHLGAADCLRRDEPLRLARAIIAAVERQRVRLGRVERAIGSPAQMFAGTGEEWAQHIVEAAPSGLWVFDCDARTVFVNAAMARMLGRTVAEMAGQPLGSFLDRASRVSVRQALDEVCRAAAPAGHIEAAFIRKDGGHLWALLALAPIRPIQTQGSDRSPGVLVAVTDITARHAAEEELRSSERRMRALLRSASDAIAVIDADGIIRYVSRSDGNLDAADGGRRFLGHHFTMQIHPEDYPTVQAAFAELIGGQRYGGPVEYRVKTSSGEARTYEAHLYGLLDHPDVRGIVASLRDITGRRAIDDARLRLAAIIQSSEDAIFSTGLDGVITSWNPAAARMFGYSLEEAIGARIGLLAAEGAVQDLDEAAAHIVHGAGLPHLETQLRHRDGHVLDVVLALSPIRDHAGRTVEASVIAHDITEQRRINNRLAQAERLSAVGELAAGVAHEVNNPLTSITLAAGLALTQDLPESAREDIETIQHQALRAGEIVRTLLRFTRARAGMSDHVHLAQVIDEALMLTGDRLKRYNIEVVRDIEPVAVIRGDPDQLLQVFLNLIDNAVDAMRDQGSGRLTCSVRAVTAGAGCCVSDTGRGFDPDVLDRVFDPFFTTKPIGEGTGLGLSIAHRIISDHGGTIVAENAPDSGGRIIMVLPLAPPVPETEVPGRWLTVVLTGPEGTADAFLAEAVRVLGYEPRLLPDGDHDDPATGEVIAVFADPRTPAAWVAHLQSRYPGARVLASAPGGPVWSGTLPDGYTLEDVERLLSAAAAVQEPRDGANSAVQVKGRL